MTARRAKNTNRQGANFELQIMHDLQRRGYDALRSSGSRGKVDVVAVGDKHLLFIQAKISQPVISPAERRAVRTMAARADAVPLVAYRINGVVMYRQLIGDGPKDFEAFWPAIHSDVKCWTCSYPFRLHATPCPMPDCKECPCGEFTLPQKESK